MAARQLSDEERQFVEANMGLVYLVVKARYPRRHPAREDAVQLGVLGLIDAVCEHRPERGEFSTLAYACIVNRLRADRGRHDTIRRPGWIFGRSDKAQAMRRSCGRTRRLTADVVAQLVSGEDDPADVAETRDAADRLHSVLPQLKPRTQSILTMWGGGSTLDQIGQRFGVTGERARQVIEAGLTRLRWHMGGPIYRGR
jgi:RNA polymerase sigma factor (sigma-70 family)